MYSVLTSARPFCTAIGIDQIIAGTGFDIDGAVAGDHAIIAGAGEAFFFRRALTGDDFDDLPAAGGDDAKTQVVDIDQQPVVGAGAY